MRMRCYYIRQGARRHILQSVTKQTWSLSLLHLLAMQSKYEFGALPLLYQYRTSIMIMHKDVWIITPTLKGPILPFLGSIFLSHLSNLIPFPGSRHPPVPHYRYPRPSYFSFPSPTNITVRQCASAVLVTALCMSFCLSVRLFVASQTSIKT